jgi:hypothetical protein
MASHDLLAAAARHAADFLETLPDARVDADVRDADALRAALAMPLSDDPVDARVVLEDLVAAATPGIVRTQSPRYFGFVIGGTLPAALAADVMTCAWDQNAAGFAVSPAASVAEEVAGGWLADLLGLPATASFGLTTGCQMAHVTCLAAARHAVLGRAARADRRQRGAPRHDRPRRAAAGLRRRLARRGRGRRARADGSRAPARRARRRRGPDHRLRPGRRREHGRLRSAR